MNYHSIATDHLEAAGAWQRTCTRTIQKLPNPLEFAWLCVNYTTVRCLELPRSGT